MKLTERIRKFWRDYFAKPTPQDLQRVREWLIVAPPEWLSIEQIADRTASTPRAVSMVLRELSETRIVLVDNRITGTWVYVVD